MARTSDHNGGGVESVPVLERNLGALTERRKRENRELPWQDRIAEFITGFTGSMTFVWLHAAGFALWIAVNLGAIPFVPKFDPTFVVLAMIASVEAIFLSTFILITQNRMMAEAEERAELNLQISLLAEHEITRLIKIVSEIGERMQVKAAGDSELPNLKQNVRPERVLDRMKEHQERQTTT